jgi:hypothetical protein
MGGKFAYTPKLTVKGVLWTPIIHLVFANPATGKSIAVDCVIDSGADTTLLHSDFAEILGININTGVPELFRGFAAEPITGYTHTVSIHLEDDANEFFVPCSFVPKLKMNGILGQIGFFDNYKVTFEKYNKTFEITPRLRRE